MGFSRLFWKLAVAQLALNAVLAAMLLGVARRRAEAGGAEAGVGPLGWLLVLGWSIAGAGALWWIAAWSWRGVKELVEAVNALARDESPPPATIDRRGETAPLALALHKLQRRLAQRFGRLDEQNERLAGVLDGMDEGVLALDGERRVLLANAASRRLLDFAAGQTVGRPLLEVVRSREIHAAVEEAFSADEVFETELEVTADPRRCLHIRAKRLPGDPSPGVLLVLNDVSQLRRLENLRTEFAANVSHELKTPLASIKAYAETLRLGAVNDPDHNLAFVARIEEHADRLHYLILDLMRLARVESGKEVFEISDFPIGELVEDCVDYHREAADAKRISVHIEPSLPLEVRGDEVGVRTILDNLVNNAIKYTSEGGQVEVAWRREGCQVLLEVRDTGIGIAPEDQDRVFERFFRVDKARARDVGGTGLGLSIVKHTALALGGKVGLESQLGCGSAFRVWLPEANGADPN